MNEKPVMASRPTKERRVLIRKKVFASKYKLYSLKIPIVALPQLWKVWGGLKTRTWDPCLLFSIHVLFDVPNPFSSLNIQILVVLLPGSSSFLNILLACKCHSDIQAFLCIEWKGRKVTNTESTLGSLVNSWLDLIFLFEMSSENQAHSSGKVLLNSKAFSSPNFLGMSWILSQD